MGMSSFVDDCENWMGLLPHYARDISIIHLAIPGSHNSMTYGITSKSVVAPDAEKIVRQLYRVVPWCIRRWAIAQTKSVTEQLHLGVRYFDLRVVCTNSEYYFAHGLYASEITEPLLKIKNFLAGHPREFVIIDFQHFYDFEQKDHEKLMQLLRDFFTEILFTQNDGTLLECTLNYASSLRKQVLIIYRKVYSEDFWLGNQWANPWPETTSVTKLEEFNNERLRGRFSEYGFVSQCILTPTVDYILPRFYKTLKFPAQKILKSLPKWLEDKKAGFFKEGESPSVNVILGDYIHINDNSFCKLVIALNEKINPPEE